MAAWSSTGWGHWRTGYKRSGTWDEPQQTKWTRNDGCHWRTGYKRSGTGDEPQQTKWTRTDRCHWPTSEASTGWKHSQIRKHGEGKVGEGMVGKRMHSRWSRYLQLRYGSETFALLVIFKGTFTIEQMTIAIASKGKVDKYGCGYIRSCDGAGGQSKLQWLMKEA